MAAFTRLIRLDEEPAVVVGKVGSTPHLAPQDDQLMSEHRILRLKPALRLERRGQHGQNKPNQRDHRASLADSVTRKIRIRFSVHTGVGRHRIEKIERFESVSVERKCIVFRHPNPARIHVDTWKNVVVERSFVGAIQANGNRDVRRKTRVKPNLPSKRTSLGVIVGNSIRLVSAVESGDALGS